MKKQLYKYKKEKKKAYKTTQKQIEDAIDALDEAIDFYKSYYSIIAFTTDRAMTRETYEIRNIIHDMYENRRKLECALKFTKHFNKKEPKYGIPLQKSVPPMPKAPRSISNED